MTEDPLRPQTLTGLDLDDDRLEEVALAFAEIRAAIERLRRFDAGEAHPAVVFAPLRQRGDDGGR